MYSSGSSVLPGSVVPKKKKPQRRRRNSEDLFKLCVVIETITLRSSFLPGIPLNSVMKSKLPFNKKIEGVFGKTVWSE